MSGTGGEETANWRAERTGSSPRLPRGRSPLVLQGEASEGGGEAGVFPALFLLKSGMETSSRLRGHEEQKYTVCMKAKPLRH